MAHESGVEPATAELVCGPTADPGITRTLQQLISDGKHQVNTVRCDAGDPTYGAIDWAVNRSVGVLFLDLERLALPADKLIRLLKGLQPFAHRFALLRQDLLHLEVMSSTQLLGAQYGANCLPVADANQAARYILRMFSVPVNKPLPAAADLDESMVDAIRHIPGFGRVSAVDLLKEVGSIDRLAQLDDSDGLRLNSVSAAKAQAARAFLFDE